MVNDASVFCDIDVRLLLQASKKKVYMLFNLEPDKSLTGGAWYSDQDFEAEFVSILSQQCYRYLKEKHDQVRDKMIGPKEAQNLSFINSKDVWKFILELGISKVSCVKNYHADFSFLCSFPAQMAPSHGSILASNFEECEMNLKVFEIKVLQVKNLNVFS